MKKSRLEIPKMSKESVRKSVDSNATKNKRSRTKSQVLQKMPSGNSETPDEHHSLNDNREKYYQGEYEGESIMEVEPTTTSTESYESTPPLDPQMHLPAKELSKKVGRLTRQEIYDLSPVFKLRRYYSEASLPKTLEERIPEAKPGPLLKERCLSVEDLILSSTGTYKDLVTGDLDEVETREYEITSKMIHDWRQLFNMERQRFSFFDELFSGGYIIESLEVPSKSGDLTNLVEADESDLKKKVDYGRVVFKTKHVYTGNFINWDFEGPGRYTWTNGTTYQGDFKNGVMHGEGVLLWKDGSIYEGQFLDGVRFGWGVYSTAEGYTYAGDWFQGLPHGKGKMWYDPESDDGDFYDGEWAGGKPHGFGTRQYGNGDRFVGDWEHGIRSGTGTMTWLHERQVYKGDWLNGVPHGRGRHTWYILRSPESNFPTRHVYQGDWEEGLRHGIGRMIYPCGSVYEGRWQHGKRHGKGVFINPAGDLLVGLFRFGSLLGGMDLPLHAPTYECDYGGLVQALCANFGLQPALNDELEPIEEKNLSDITLRYLGDIRKLYKRAGALGECWGNQGAFPNWTQVYKSLSKKHFKYNADKRKMSGVKRFQMKIDDEVSKESPDNVHPLTRFGLWLLLRDCPGILMDLTIAEFDNFWGAVSSISFQTRHNPFEPVYLWQFLQCLVVIASIIYVEIPRRKQLLRIDVQEDKPWRSRRSSATGTSFMSEAEPEETIIPEEIPLPQPETQITPAPITEPNLTPDIPDEDCVEGEYVGEDEEWLGESSIKYCKQYPLRRKSDAGTQNPSKTDLANQQGTTDETESVPSSAAPPPTPQNDKPKISELFEKLLVEKLIPCLSVEQGTNLPPVPNPLPSLADLQKSFETATDGQDTITGIEYLRSVLPHKLETGDDPIYWTRCKEVFRPVENMEDTTRALYEKPEGNYLFDPENMVQFGSEFLGDKFGKDYMSLFTPMMREEVITETPHHGRKRASIQIFGLGNKIFGIDPETGERAHTAAISHHHSETEEEEGELEDGETQIVEAPDDAVIDATIFSERDLAPEPFLWTQESKCSTIPRKEQAFSNLGSKDVMKVLRYLYPKFCGQPLETDLSFDMTFCDWLFGMSMVAKISADRDFYKAMKKESLIEHRPYSARRLSTAPIPGNSNTSTPGKKTKKKIITGKRFL